jgi:hypothetical protein
MPLEISGGHFVYLRNNTLVRAQDVRVGDMLKSDTTDMVVTRIESIQRQGLYAPATENGKIWVSGVTTSSYISLIDDDEIVSSNMQAVLSHVALAPLRMVCKISSFSICQNESYSEDGYSMNLWSLIQFGHYFMAMAIPMKVTTLIVMVPMLFAVSGMETVLSHGTWTSILAVGLAIVTFFQLKTITKVKTASKG